MHTQQAHQLLLIGLQQQQTPIKNMDGAAMAIHVRVPTITLLVIWSLSLHVPDKQTVRRTMLYQNYVCYAPHHSDIRYLKVN